MLVAGARYREHGILHTRWKTGFRVEHLGRLQGAEDAATVGSTRLGPIHDWKRDIYRDFGRLYCFVLGDIL